MNKLVAIALIFLQVSHGLAATYYIDYVGGSDTNNGTSTATPWKHHPYMRGGRSADGGAVFSGSYTHADGDRFIFKGGVTWPNAALPLYITIGGTVDNPDYYGVDATWYDGAEWARPVFDAEGQPFVNGIANNTRGNLIRVRGSSSYGVYFDSLELKGHSKRQVNSSVTYDFAIQLFQTSGITISNCYAHSWVVRCNKDGKWGGFGTDSSSGERVINSMVVGPLVNYPITNFTDGVVYTAAGLSSGAGIYGGWSLVQGCYIENTTQGTFGGGIYRSNTICNVRGSYSSTSHENAVWFQDGSEFSGNVIANCNGGVGMYVLPGWGQGVGDPASRLSVFNNVFYNCPQISISNENATTNGNTVLFFNNIAGPGGALNIGGSDTTVPFGTMVLQNNIIMRSVRITDPTDLGSSYTNTPNVYWTELQASDAGMTTNNWYLPTGDISPELQGGTALTAYASTDFNGVTRPTDFWVMGPYQTPAGSVAVPDVPTGLSATATLGQIVVNWSDVSGATSYVVSRAVGVGSYSAVATNSVSEYTDTAVSGGTLYSYKVVARNTAGDSSESSVVSTTAPTSTPPDSPATFTATLSGTTVSLSWSASTGATSYALDRLSGFSGDYVLVTNTTSTSYSDTTPGAGTITYRLSANNSGGSSDPVFASTYIQQAAGKAQGKTKAQGKVRSR